MPTITETDLINLKNALEDMNTTFAQIAEGVYAGMGGVRPADVDPGDVEIDASSSDEEAVADALLAISENLVWITDAVNAVFSIQNIALESAAQTEVTTIKAPPQDPEPKET